MQVIRFTYNSANIELSVFLLLYLRMNGIYVYERFFDFGLNESKQLLRIFEDMSQTKYPEIYTQYDMELFAIESEQDFLEYHRYADINKAVLLISGEWQLKYEAELQMCSVINCDLVGKTSLNLLNNLIDVMWKKGLLPQNSREAFYSTADVYSKNNMMKLSFRAKYFYIADMEVQYEQIIAEYRKICEGLREKLVELENMWGNVRSIYLQYAVLNLAYEGDLYCKRNKKRFIYIPDSIINVSETLLEKKDIQLLFGESIHLLMAQVYDDLIGDTQGAYFNYRVACKDYNSYAYYKKAVHLVNIEKNYEKALDYLIRSIYIYPCYYRAWYMLGITSIKLDKWEMAAHAFESMEIVLSSRIEANKLRPMEIEYLFKAAIQCGDIFYRRFHIVPVAIRKYLFAEKIWKAIDSSLFLSKMGFQIREQINFKERMKRELNIEIVYLKLENLYRLVGDNERANRYFVKITK